MGWNYQIFSWLGGGDFRHPTQYGKPWTLEDPRSISKTCRNSAWFFLDHPCKFLFLAPEISTICFFNTPGNSMSSTPLYVFFLKKVILAVKLTISYNLYISSFWWVVNILLRKFNTSSKKKKKIKKRKIKRNENDKNVNIWWKLKKCQESICISV